MDGLDALEIEDLQTQRCREDIAELIGYSARGSKAEVVPHVRDIRSNVGPGPYKPGRRGDRPVMR
jgi:hypothetical protein